MASANVDKALNYLMNTPVMVHRLHVIFAEIEAGAGVHFSNEEKIEFLKEIAGTATAEPSITFKW